MGEIGEGDKIMEKEIKPFLFPYLRKLEITSKGLTSLEGLPDFNALPLKTRFEIERYPPGEGDKEVACTQPAMYAREQRPSGYEADVVLFDIMFPF